MLVALSRGESWGWTAAPTVAAFALGAAALALFVRHELRTAVPMIDLRLLRRRSLATANLAAMASSAALFGTLILLPFYLTAVLGFAPVQLAIGITPIAASFMLVAPLAGRAIAPVGSERLATIGFVVSASGALWMAVAAGAQSYAVLLPGIIAFGVGLATSTSSITMTAIDGVPAARLGVASALPNISRYIGGALGAALLGTVLHANLPACAGGRVGPARRRRARPGGRRVPLRAARGGGVPGPRGARRVADAPPGRPRGRSPPPRRGAPLRRAGRPVSALPRVAAFLAPVRDTPDHIRLAEELGFSAAWVYDSPLLYHDPFATLARAADRTSRIGLGIGVVVPGLRAPAATAAGLRTLAALAPGRVRAALGAGFTGRFTLGLGPVPIRRLARELDDVRGLLAGEERAHVEGGAPIRDMPVPGAEGGGEVPLFVSCRGPRAQALARDRGDGAMTGILYPGGLQALRAGVGDRIPLGGPRGGRGGRRRRAARLAPPARGRRTGGGASRSTRSRSSRGASRGCRMRSARGRGRTSTWSSAARRPAPSPGAAPGAPDRVVLPEDRAVMTPGPSRRLSFTGTAAQLRDRAGAWPPTASANSPCSRAATSPDELRRLAAALLD